MGPSVEPVGRGRVLWHAPGTYARDLPGLDYEFELVFSDVSTMWDWTVRDFEGCYDALRVHMGAVPQEAQRLELRLADPVVEWYDGLYVGTGFYHAPWGNPATVPWDAWPYWEPADLTHPNLADVESGCYRQPSGRALCDIYPKWGNSHSIHLPAAAAKTMANSISYLSDQSLAERYNRVSDRVLQANAYLFPLGDRLGDPAGYGSLSGPVARRLGGGHGSAADWDRNSAHGWPTGHSVHCRPQRWKQERLQLLGRLPQALLRLP